MSLSRRGWLVVAAAAAALVAVSTVAVFGRTSSETATVVRSARRLLAMETVSLSMRTSLRSDAGVHFTDSSAIVDLRADKAYVELPDVLRNGPLKLVSADRTLFVTVPPELAEQFGGVRWLRLETADRAQARGAYFGPVPDPATVMLAVAGATGKAADLGSRTLDGVKVDVIRVRVEPRRMASHLSADYVSAANKLGSISLHWDGEVWLDRHQIPRRVRLTTKVEPTGQPPGRLAIDLRLGGFNEPVTIGIPPAAATRPVGSVEEALSLLGVVPR